MLQLDDTRAIDIHHFRLRIAAASGGDSAAIDYKMLEAATALYAGPFLDGEDDCWVLEEREALHCVYVRALTELMRWTAEQDRFEDALAYGRRILACDPTRETIQRWVMLLYVLNGQRGEAVRQYDRCHHALLDTCDVEPMPETTKLAAMIRSGELLTRLPELRQAMWVIDGRDPFLLSLH
ncbi:bacterial transcriptional activator domain-containing protein [Bradyrhizobium sp. USDA 3397]